MARHPCEGRDPASSISHWITVFSPCPALSRASISHAERWMAGSGPAMERGWESRSLTLFLPYDICLRDGPGKEGPVSRACLNRQIHVQRPRSVSKALADPGSRMRAPRILRSERGSPQFTHALHLLCSKQPRRRPAWNWRVSALQAKTAAFPDTALRRPTPLSPIQACWRGAGTETVPPLSSRIPMPP